MMIRKARVRQTHALALLATSTLGLACFHQPSQDAQDKPAPLEPPSKPIAESYRKARHRMVDTQIKARGVRDPQVLEAMRKVPRHLFVPEAMRAFAYQDHALSIGEGQTISQPYMVAFMTEALQLEPNAKVLEIGTGSGYQAAILAELTPHVYTIEIVETLANRAAETFKRRGYDSINTRIGDGYAGWPEQAPFDAIIVTCAPGHIPPRLFEQLKVDGRMCIPVGDQRRGQQLQRITKRPDGSMETKSLIPVRFVPMTGQAQATGNDDAEQ